MLECQGHAKYNRFILRPFLTKYTGIRDTVLSILSSNSLLKGIWNQCLLSEASEHLTIAWLRVFSACCLKKNMFWYFCKTKGSGEVFGLTPVTILWLSHDKPMIARENYMGQNPAWMIKHDQTKCIYVVFLSSQHWIQKKMKKCC